jgi:hypothetical protein
LFLPGSLAIGRDAAEGGGHHGNGHGGYELVPLRRSIAAVEMNSGRTTPGLMTTGLTGIVLKRVRFRLGNSYRLRPKPHTCVETTTSSV